MLRKIFVFSSISFNFEFLSTDFVDNINPSLKIDVSVEKMEGQLNSNEWWHFSQIIQAIMLSRGEKAAEVIMIEKWRNREMKRLDLDYIGAMIKTKLKNSYKNQHDERPDLAKNIIFNIGTGKLKLFNLEAKHFASVDVKGVHGNQLFYSNRESK